jgi:hypothetical protein
VHDHLLVNGADEEVILVLSALEPAIRETEHVDLGVTRLRAGRNLELQLGLGGQAAPPFIYPGYGVERAASRDVEVEREWG